MMTSERPPERGGRVPLGNRKRRGKEITLSPAAWLWLEWYTKHSGLGTISQAVEVIIRTHRDFTVELPASK